MSHAGVVPAPMEGADPGADDGTRTTITLLDRVSITGPGGVGTEEMLPGSQPKVALAHLILERRAPVPLDRLVEVIWEDAAPTTWRPALRGLVSKVRTFITTAAPTATLEAASGGYVLSLPEPVEIDVETARSSARGAEEALARDDLTVAVEFAARAHTLGRGAFLPRSSGLWIDRIATDLRDIQVRSLHVLGEVHIRRGEPTRAVRTAAEAIEVSPLHEASHRLAMRALAAAGETGQAAQAFDRCRRMLGDQLGVGPSRQTTQLLASILRD